MEYKGQKFVFDRGPRLGGGGMAEVYLASRKDAPDLHVALKIPRPDLAPSIQELFLREAEAAQRVSSPHVVQVVDWGNEPPFIAFEFIQGATLAQQLRVRQGNKDFWSEAELIGLFQQLVAGMSAITPEVIHRDLKPENIFFDGATLKVGDFGIAKYVGEITRSKTFKGWGTPHYMAPETFRGESIDWRSDQYSLGVIFYEMATLERPFVGDWNELERLHLFQRPPRVTAISSGLSHRLATMVARMLEKRANQRYSSWEALVAELDALQQGLSPAGGPSPSDPLVGKAAEQLEVVRSRELERERLESERRAKVMWREELLKYWAGELLGQTASRIQSLNQSLGDNVISYNVAPPSDSKQQCSAKFLHAQLTIDLETIPLSLSDNLFLWGVIRLSTNHRGWFGNLLLTAEPPPYGAWYEVDMRVSGLMRGDYRPQDKIGGGYETIGPERIVLALNPQALIDQRYQRNVTSEVNYQEKPLDFNAVLDELMHILVEDAAIESPRSTERGHRGGSRPFSPS